MVQIEDQRYLYIVTIAYEYVENGESVKFINKLEWRSTALVDIKVMGGEAVDDRSELEADIDIVKARLGTVQAKLGGSNILRSLFS